MALVGNKGEWSEVLALFYILSSNVLHATDFKFEKQSIESSPVVGLERKDKLGNFLFKINDQIDIYLNGKFKLKISKAEFSEEYYYLLNELLKAQKTSFLIPKTESFLSRIGITSLKAPSRDKSDIILHLKDIFTSNIYKVAFSIKSQLGHSSSLLNASKSTNFIFRVRGNYLVKKFHTLHESLDCVSNNLEYISTENPTFLANLQFIDNQFDELLATALIQYYCHRTRSCKSVVEKLTQLNPLNLLNIKSYEIKFKSFLRSIALGMKPSTPWDGKDEACGGFLIIKSNSDILLYHQKNRNEFEDYLLNNTKFETPSTTRHKFGFVYEESGENRIKLNLQIRFI